MEFSSAEMHENLPRYVHFEPAQNMAASAKNPVRNKSLDIL